MIYIYILYTHTLYIYIYPLYIIYIYVSFIYIKYSIILISKIYKKLKKQKKQIVKTKFKPFKKMNYGSKQFSKQEVKMAKEYLKKC